MSERAAELLELAKNAVRLAQKYGAQDAAAGVGKSRDVEVQWRDGKLEKISEATSRQLGLSLYVDGKYASVGTSDLRPEALQRFIADAVSLTKTLSPDPFRKLPDPELYKGQRDLDLQLDDARYNDVTAEQRLKAVRDCEDACRAYEGSKAPILSVTTGWSDSFGESWRVHSNGFEGYRRGTSFWLSASVTLQDSDGRRPEESGYGGSRFANEVPAAGHVAQQAMARAQGRLGAKKGKSAVVPMMLENRVSGRMLGSFLGPLNAASIQQKRSYFEGRIGEKLASDKLTIVDDPFVVRGFGSHLFDGEGLAAKEVTIVDRGVIKNAFVDTYYGRKLGWKPTTGGMSNLRWSYGDNGQAALLADMGEGYLVTGFLGGNANGTTGDFSFGVQGFSVKNGKIAEPMSEMNISGSHKEIWQRLRAIGNDPYAYSAMRSPTLVFDGIQFAGEQ